MGVAILSGVLASLESRTRAAPLDRVAEKWEVHTPGTATPTGQLDGALPSRFIACVSRDETATRLRKTFRDLSGRGHDVEVLTRQNVQAVQQADLVLLWYAAGLTTRTTVDTVSAAVSHSSRRQSSTRKACGKRSPTSSSLAFSLESPSLNCRVGSYLALES